MDDESLNLIKQTNILLSTSTDITEQERIDLLYSLLNPYITIFQLSFKDDSKLFSEVLNCIKSTIKLIQATIYYCSEKGNSDKITALLLLLMKSEVFLPNLIVEFSILTNAYLFCNIKCDDFIPLSDYIISFFSNPIFCKPFELLDGFNSIFNILIDTKKSAIAQMVIHSILPTLKYYFTDEAQFNQFLLKCMDILHVIPFHNASPTFTLLYNILITRKPNITSNFIWEKFDLVNQYIKSEKAGNLLFIYSIFFDLIHIPEQLESLNCLLTKLIDLINTSNNFPDVKKSALCSLKLFLSNYTDQFPIELDHVYSISHQIDQDDIPSILVFLDIIKYVCNHFTVNLLILSPTIHRFISKENMIKYDFSDVFDILKQLGNEFQKVATSFILPLFNHSQPEEILQLFVKYPDFFDLFPLAFLGTNISHKELLFFKLFIDSQLHECQPDAFYNAFDRIINVDSFFESIFEYLNEIDHVDIFLKYSALCFRFNFSLKQSILSTLDLNKLVDLVNLKKIDYLIFFDFVSCLATTKFNEKLDQDIFKVFEKNNYFNQSSLSIQKVAFGRLQTENFDDAILVLPSLLSKAHSFELNNQSDLYLAAKYSFKHFPNLEQFPCLEKVVKRFVEPEDLFSLLKCDMKNFISNEFDCIPLFEFTKAINNTRLIINADSECFSLSVWFYFTRFFNQNIMEFSNMFIQTDENGCIHLITKESVEKLGEYSLNQWLNVTFCIGLDCLDIYINSSYLMSLLITSKSFCFGEMKENQETWYIGGYIKTFSEKLDQISVETIYKDGVYHLPKKHKNQKQWIDANSFKEIDSNLRLVPSQPFLLLLSHYIGPNNFLTFILQNDAFFEPFLYYSKLYFDGNFYDLTMTLSILANLKLSLFKSSHFDLINSIFEKNDEIQWNYFFGFYLDKHFFENESIIDQIIQFIEKHKTDFINNIGTYKNAIFRFAIEISSFSNSFINFLNLFEIDNNQLCIHLCSLLSKHNQSQLVNYLKYRIPTTLFKHYFILNILNGKEALDLVYLIISKAEEIPNKIVLMRICLLNVEYLKAWDCAISLLICSPINFEVNSNFDFDKLDLSLIPTFLVMLSILFSVSLQFDKDSIWKSLAYSMVGFLESTMDHFNKTDQILFLMSNLSFFNTYVNTECLFAIAPTMTKLTEIAPISLSRSQIFEKGMGKEYEESKLQININKEQCYTTINEMQTKIDFIPPFTNKSIEIVKNICIDYEFDQNWNSLREFIQSKIDDFHLEKTVINDSYLQEVQISRVATCVLDILSHYLFSFISTKDFIVKLETMTICLYRLHPSHIVFITQRLILSLLNECIDNSIFCLDLIEFACNRAREGWFADQVAPLVSLMISLCQLTHNDLPENLFSLLLIGFEIISFKQFPIYIEIYITYQDIIFTENNLNEQCFLMLVEYILKFKHVVPDSFQRFFDLIYEKISIFQINSIDLELLSNYLIELKNNFTDFKENSEQNEFIEKFVSKRYRAISSFVEGQYHLVMNSLEKESLYVFNRRTEFVLSNREFLTKIRNGIFESHVIYLNIVSKSNQIESFDFDCFLRYREFYLTSVMDIDHNKGNSSSISLLSNQLYPSKRIERSVLYLNQTTKNRNELIMKPIDFVNYLQFENLKINTKLIQNVLYSSHQVFGLQFSQFFDLIDMYRYQEFKLLYGPFVFSTDASFMYGIESISGTFLKTVDSIIFIEGATLTDHKLTFKENELSSFVNHFYLNYFISNMFGPCTLFCGHCVLKWNLKDIINIIQKVDESNSFEYEFNFISGWTFIIKANLTDILPYLKNTSLPFNTFALSILKKELTVVTDLWSKGFYDNFTYLCYLNLISGRSFCDFANYPVFPQLFDNFEKIELRDLSKPIGQLNKDKACYFDSVFERSNGKYFYEESFMSIENVFSSCLDFQPFNILANSFIINSQVNVKKFDLKHSIESVLNVSEVVPQLYSVPEIAQHFELPIFCSGLSPPLNFVFTCQEILQSEKVTAKLGNWIDIIFGYLMNSIEFKNVHSFEKVKTPNQLFKKPHEKAQFLNSSLIKQKSTPEPIPPVRTRTRSNTFSTKSSPDLVLHDQLAQFNIDLPSQTTDEIQTNEFRSRNHIMTTPDYLVFQKVDSSIIPNNFSELLFNSDSSSIISLNQLTTQLSPSVSLSVCVNQKCIVKNNSIVIKTSNLFSSAVYLSASTTLCLLAVTHRTGSVSIWEIQYEGDSPIDLKLLTVFQLFDLSIYNSIENQQLISNMKHQFSKVLFSPSHFLAICASGDRVIRYDVGRRKLIDPIEVGYTINNLCIDEYAPQIITCGDSEFTLWTIGGTLIYRQKCGMRVQSIAVSQLPCYVKNRFIVTIHENGFAVFWTYDYKNGMVEILKQKKVSSNPLKTISIDKESSSRVVVSDVNNNVFVFDFAGTKRNPLARELISNCAHCGSKLDFSKSKTASGNAVIKKIVVCSKCHRYFCNNCVKEVAKRMLPMKQYMCSFCCSRFKK